MPHAAHSCPEKVHGGILLPLVSCNSPFTICLGEEDLASPTPDTEPGQQPSRCTECLHEPAASDKPSPSGATELKIAMEPELLYTSDQVRELATALVREFTVESEGME